MPKHLKRKIVLPEGLELPTETPLNSVEMPFWKILPVRNDRIGPLPILSNRLTTMAFHFVGKSSVLCLKHVLGSCEWCSERRRIVEGFLPVWFQLEKSVRLLPLTAGAIRQCPSVAERGDLFGRTITAWRTRTTGRGPVFCQISTEVVHELDMGKCFTQKFVRDVVLNIRGLCVENEDRNQRPSSGTSKRKEG
jgi:hypothetical protein